MARKKKLKPEAAKFRARMKSLVPPGNTSVTARRVVKTRQGYMQVTNNRDFALRDSAAVPKVTKAPARIVRKGQQLDPGTVRPTHITTAPAQEMPNYMQPWYKQRLANADTIRRYLRTRQSGPYDVPGQNSHYTKKRVLHALPDRPYLT
jgi:hypothetical protein